MPDFVGKLYYESGSEGCKVHNLKTSFCTILALYITMNGKRLDYKALEKVFPIIGNGRHTCTLLIYSWYKINHYMYTKATITCTRTKCNAL